MNKNEILERLKEGNNNFINDKLNSNNQNSKRRASLTDGQNPFATILCCADSRVVPELVFDTGLGELFVIGVAGNIANTSSVASIEYAVAKLDMTVIVVLGHESCGAVTAAVSGDDYGYNLNHLLAHIKPAISSVAKNATVNDVAKANALQNARDLVGRSSIISDAVKSGKLDIHAAYYNLESGKVGFLSK